MAIKGAKTIAEYSIRRWLEKENFVMDFFKFEMTEDCKAVITDASGDTMTLTYDKDTITVYAE